MREKSEDQHERTARVEREKVGDRVSVRSGRFG